MTVAELIEELKKMPQDADVYKENVQYGYGYANDETFVWEVVKDECGYSVTIK